jgi:hypothetical protein
LRYVVEVAELYGLPYPYDLFDTPPDKYQWKQLVNKAVENLETCFCRIMVPVAILAFRAANDTAYGSEPQDF